MKKSLIYIICTVFAVISCNKDTEPEGPILPTGATAYEASEIAFVPYGSGSGEQVFKKAPGFTSELTLTFKERLATEEAFAWDQTFLTFNTDVGLEVELRLRYLQAETEYHKSLAIYMPYRDEVAVVRTTVFETPIDETVLGTSFFADLVTFHDTLAIYGAERYDVFEINPLTSTEASIDSETNFTKIYYNSTFGILQMDQKNGDVWILHP
jgi:hypothetical protein